MRIIIIILFIFTSLSLTVSAQVGTHFADSNAVWKINYRWMPPSPFGYNGYAENYISGDTIINDKVYKKIGKTGYDIFCTDIITSGPDYMGALREDTTQNKVFFIPDGFQNDTLLYDYNLQVGDTLPPGYNTMFLGGELFVAFIDTIETIGVLRQRWNLEAEYYGQFASIIEGIGSTTGLLEEIYMFEADAFLRCYYQNDTAVYTGGVSANECVMPTDSCYFLGIYEEDILDVTCYPNPANDWLHITFSGNVSIEQVQIYDHIGRKVLLVSLNYEKIDVSELKPGMYFVSVLTNKGRSVQKLIIQ